METLFLGNSPKLIFFATVVFILLPKWNDDGESEKGGVFGEFHC